MIKNNNNFKYKRQSPAKWCEEMNLTITNFSKGFTHDEYFDGVLSREEFLNKASLCEFAAPEVKSRREAAVYFSKLNNKNNN